MIATKRFLKNLSWASNFIFTTLLAGIEFYSGEMGKRRKLVGKKDRELLVREKVLDLGNIILSGLLVSQIFKEEFSLWVHLIILG